VVAADQAGDSNNNPATEVTRTVTVTPATLTVVVNGAIERMGEQSGFRWHAHGRGSG